jgi:hypothetical protein
MQISTAITLFIAVLVVSIVLSILGIRLVFKLLMPEKRKKRTVSEFEGLI